MSGTSTQIETKQDSLGAGDGSFETESHQQQMRQSLRTSLDGGLERRRRAVHPPLREESGSQLAARLNSSTFGTEQVTLRAQCAHATCRLGLTCRVLFCASLLWALMTSAVSTV